MVDILDPLEKICNVVLAIKELVEISRSKDEWFESCYRFMNSILEPIENYKKNRDPSKAIPMACGELLKELEKFRDFLEKESKRSGLMSFFLGSSITKEGEEIKERIRTNVGNFTQALVVESLIENKENFKKVLSSKSQTKQFKPNFENEQAGDMWMYFFNNEDNVSWVDFGQALKKFAKENDKIELTEAQIEVILSTIDKDHNFLIQMEEWDLFYRSYWSKKEMREELLKSNAFVKKSSILINPIILQITRANSNGIPQKYRYNQGHEFFISENQVEFNCEGKEMKIVKRWDKEALIVGRDDPGRFRPDIYFPSQNTSIQKKQFQITLKKMIGSQGFFINNLSISCPTSLRIENIPFVVSSQMMFSLQETLFEVTEIDPEPSTNLKEDDPDYFLVNFLEKEEEDPNNAPTIKPPRKKKKKSGGDEEETNFLRKGKKAPISLPFIKLRIINDKVKNEYEFHVEKRKEEKFIRIGSKESNEIVIKEIENMQVVIKWESIMKQWVIFTENKNDEAYLYLIKASDFHAKTIGKLSVKLRDKMTIAFDENEMKKNNKKEVIAIDDALRLEWTYQQCLEKDSIILSKPLGFRLTTLQKSQTFSYHFLEESSIDLWKNTLSNFIIQLGFHSHYEALKKIGKGHFSSIFLVKHRYSGQIFAAKAYSKEYMSVDPRIKASFYHEAAILRILKDHPHIVKLYEVFESENSFYLIIEYLSGGGLFPSLAKKTFLNEKDIAKISLKILEAAAFIHEKGIMHRDLSPENILLKNLEDDFHIKIVDFGLSCFIHEEKPIFIKCGTPGFFAPEILNNKIKSSSLLYNEKCDVFSLGVMLYIMFTGKSPFNGKNKDEILENNRKNMVDFKNIECSSNAKDLLRSMLENDPNKRKSLKECMKMPFFTQFSLCKHDEDDIIEEQVPEEEEINLSKINEFQTFCQQKSSPFYSFVSPLNSPKGVQPIPHVNRDLFQIKLKTIESSFIEVMEKAQELTVIIEKNKN